MAEVMAEMRHSEEVVAEERKRMAEAVAEERKRMAEAVAGVRSLTEAAENIAEKMRRPDANVIAVKSSTEAVEIIGTGKSLATGRDMAVWPLQNRRREKKTRIDLKSAISDREIGYESRNRI